MSCRKGCCGHALLLTSSEVDLLKRLGQTPFLPVASKRDRETPVYLEEPEGQTMQEAILGLSLKGLLQLDYDIPLQGFDYRAYEAYPLHGSMALTAHGQSILEQIEIQGIEEGGESC